MPSEDIYESHDFPVEPTVLRIAPPIFDPLDDYATNATSKQAYRDLVDATSYLIMRVGLYVAANALIEHCRSWDSICHDTMEREQKGAFLGEHRDQILDWLVLASEQAAIKSHDVKLAVDRLRTTIWTSAYRDAIDQQSFTAAQQKLSAMLGDTRSARDSAAHPEIRHGTTKNHAMGPFSIPAINVGEGAAMSIGLSMSDGVITTTKGTKKSGDHEALVISTPVGINAARDVVALVEAMFASLPSRSNGETQG